jgi:hypothetical protein
MAGNIGLSRLVAIQKAGPPHLVQRRTKRPRILKMAERAD